MSEEEKYQGLTIKVTATGLDEIQGKVDRLTASLREANAALKELCGGINVEVYSKALVAEINKDLGEIASKHERKYQEAWDSSEKPTRDNA